MISDVNNHLKEHETVVRTGYKRILQIAQITDYMHWCPSIHEVEGQRFFLQCIRQDNVFMAWVMVEAGRREATKWRAIVTLKKESNEKAKFISEIDVVPIDVPTASVVESGEFATIPENMFKKFETTSVIIVSFELKKV